MLRDITLGQYYQAESVIHRLDPRFKLLAIFVYVISLFIAQSFLSYAFIAVCLAVTLKASKVPPSFAMRGLKSIVFIILFTVTINLLMTPGSTVLFTVWKVTVTLEAVSVSVRMALRLILIIIGSSLLTLTTSPIQLTDGLEYILKPLKRFHVPAHDIAMTMTIALRFIPTLLEETDKIMKAQQARGADFETGGLIKRAKSMLPILVPLFISAFRRAEDLSLAMEARCYHGDDGNRTRMKSMQFAKIDSVGMFCMLLFVGAVIVMRLI